MHKDTFLMTLGGLVFIMPLLGIPMRWKDPALFTFGALILFVALLYRLEARRRERNEGDVAHTENNPGVTSSDVVRSAM